MNLQQIKKQQEDNTKRLKEIAYEFRNQECYYTGKCGVVADMFPDINRERIYQVFEKEYVKEYKKLNL